MAQRNECVLFFSSFTFKFILLFSFSIYQKLCWYKSLASAGQSFVICVPRILEYSVKDGSYYLIVFSINISRETFLSGLGLECSIFLFSKITTCSLSAHTHTREILTWPRYLAWIESKRSEIKALVLENIICLKC